MSALATATPITSRAVAITALRSARRELEAVRDSTLPGIPLYMAMQSAIIELSGAINGLQTLAVLTGPERVGEAVR